MADVLLDNAAFIGTVNTATSVTGSMTVANHTNRKLAVFVSIDQADYITGVTYNGVALTKRHLLTPQNGSQYWASWWDLDNPTVGTFNVVVSSSQSRVIQVYAVSLYNVKSGAPDNISSRSDAPGSTTFALAITPNTDRCYLCFGVGAYCNGAALTAGANTTRDVVEPTYGGTALYHYTSNIVSPAASTTLNAIQPGTAQQPFQGILVSYAPLGAATFSITENVLPSNHIGSTLTVHAVGTTTTWDSSTVFTVSGVTGWGLSSKVNVDATHYTLVLSCPDVATPPAGTTGTLTISDTTNSISTTVTVATPTISASPSIGTNSTTGNTTFTGVNTLWSTDTPTFTLSGGTGASIGATTVLTNTSASAVVTYGSSIGSLYIKDVSTGAQCTVSITNTIPVSSIAAKFSPGNWSGGRVTETGVRRAWANGAWCVFNWTTSQTSPVATLKITSTGSNSIVFFVNGKYYDNSGSGYTANADIAIPGLSGAGTYTVYVYLRNSTQATRWSGVNCVKITGLAIDGTAGLAPAKQSWAMIIGDSITEGIAANDGSDSNLSCYSFLVGQSLLQAGFDYCISACGYSGWIQTGDGYNSGDVPDYYKITGSSAGSGGTYDDTNSRWNKVDSSESLLDSNNHISAYGAISQEPSLILINYGTNEALSSSNVSNMQASITQGIGALRLASPNAYILILMPMNLKVTTIAGYSGSLTYTNAITSGVAVYKAANPTDTKVSLVDLGIEQVLATLGGGGVHPNRAGHSYAASRIGSVLIQKLSSSGASGFFGNNLSGGMIS